MLDVRSNFLSQKIDFVDGNHVLTKTEAQRVFSQSDPETYALFEGSMSQQQLGTIFSVAGLASGIGTAVYGLTPQNENSANLFWPLAISSVALEIVSGIFRKKSIGLAEEAVASYNFGLDEGPPVYYEEKRVDAPIFTYVINF